jgi:hypothetical protein
VSYVFTVRALSGAGWSAYSAPSAPVTVGDELTTGTGSILIVGSRGVVGARQGVVVEGTTIGIAVGTVITPYVKFPGPTEYTADTAIQRVRIVEGDRGTFTWSRRTGKKTYVYFTAASGERSQRIAIPAKARMVGTARSGRCGLKHLPVPSWQAGMEVLDRYIRNREGQ